MNLSLKSVIKLIKNSRDYAQVNAHCLKYFFNLKIFKEDHRVCTIKWRNGNTRHFCTCGFKFPEKIMSEGLKVSMSGLVKEKK